MKKCITRGAQMAVIKRPRDHINNGVAVRRGYTIGNF